MASSAALILLLEHVKANGQAGGTQWRDVSQKFTRSKAPTTEPLQNITVNFKVVANLAYPDKTSRHEVKYDTTGSSSNLYAEETELARTTDLHLCRAKSSQHVFKHCKRMFYAESVRKLKSADSNNCGGKLKPFMNISCVLLHLGLISASVVTIIALNFLLLVN